MADFNETIQQTETPDYTGVSQGYKDNALGTLFSNISENFDAGVKAGDAFIQRRLGESARNMVEPLRDGAIADVAGYQGNAVSYTDENGNTSATAVDGDNTSTGALPQEAGTQFDRLGLVKQGVKAGRLSDSYYRSQLDVVSKKLRRMYPGYEDQIDDRMQALTGSVPANKLLADLQAEASAASSAGSQNKALALWTEGIKDGTIDGTVHPFSSYNGSIEAIARDISPKAMAKAAANLRSTNLSNEAAAGKLDVDHATRSLNDTMSDTTTSVISDVTGSFGKNYPQLKAKIDQMDATKPWTPQEILEIDAQHTKMVQALRAKLGAVASNPINDQGQSYSTFVGQDNVTAAVEAQIKRVDGMFFGITNKDPTWMSHNAAVGETYKQGDLAVLRSDPFDTRVESMNTMFGQAGVSNFMLDKSNMGSFLSHTALLQSHAILTGLMTSDSGDPRLAKYDTIDAAIKDVVDPNTKSADREALKTAVIGHLKSKVSDETIPVDMRLKIANALYGPNNAQFATKTIPVFNQMVDPTTLRGVHKLAQDTGHPEVWNNAVNWTMGTGTTLARNFAIQMSQANLDPNTAVTYSTTTHMFGLNYPKVQNPKSGGYRDHQADQAAVDNMNRIVQSMIPVLKEDSPKTGSEDVNKWVSGMTNAFGEGLGVPIFKSFSRAANPPGATPQPPLFSFDQNGRVQLNFQRNPETGVVEHRTTPNDQESAPTRGGRRGLGGPQEAVQGLGTDGQGGSSDPLQGGVTNVPESLTGAPSPSAISQGQMDTRSGIIKEINDLHDGLSKATDPKIKAMYQDELNHRFDELGHLRSNTQGSSATPFHLTPRN